jgi:hypothetical protein
MRTYGESQVFGDETNLPGAEILDGFDFRRNVLEGSFSIASNPDFPDHVVRLNSVPLDSDPRYVTTQGIRHFGAMADSGLTIPNQRFIVASGVHGEEPYLYAVTDRIDGRDLTNNSDDAELAQPVINGLAKYTMWALNDTENLYLWDKFLPWQSTVKADGQVVMHDVGLDFQAARNGKKPSDDLYLGALGLEEWSQEAGLQLSKEVRILMRQVESLPRRAVRRLVTKFLG